MPSYMLHPSVERETMGRIKILTEACLLSQQYQHCVLFHVSPDPLNIVCKADSQLQLVVDITNWPYWGLDLHGSSPFFSPHLGIAYERAQRDDWDCTIVISSLLQTFAHMPPLWNIHLVYWCHTLDILIPCIYKILPFEILGEANMKWHHEMHIHLITELYKSYAWFWCSESSKEVWLENFKVTDDGHS